MKRIKKLAALMMAAIMVLAMGMTAFAAEKKVISITNPTKGHVYTAYQILKGEKVGAELTNLDWGNGITEDGKTALKTALGLPAGATVVEVAVKLSDIDSDSDSMDAVAQILGDNIVEGSGTVLAPDGTAVTATVDQGYYVVVDKGGTGADADTTYSKYMVQVVGNVSIETKAEKTTSQKTVKDGEDAKAKFTEANIGETRTFYLTATLPDDYAAYTAFYMNFRDTMNAMDYVALTSVTVKKDVKIEDVEGKKVYDPSTGTVVATINKQGEDVDVIDGYNLTAPKASEDGNVTNVEQTQLSVELMDLKQIVPAAAAGNCVIVEYQAKLNEKAVINGANVNEFDLVFSNNPNSTVKPEKPDEKPEIPTGETPKDKAELYTTEIELLKKDGTTGDILRGAEFTLTGETNNVVIKTAETFTEDGNGEYWKLKNDTYTKTEPTDDTADRYDSTTKKYTMEVKTVVLGMPKNVEIKAEVGADGKVTFSGLGEGTYTLTESKVPEGYNQMDPIKFKITFDKTKKEFTASEGLTALVTDIDNFSGSTLPSTGGIGTTIFYVVGAILVIGAGVILVTKKRMSKEV